MKISGQHAATIASEIAKGQFLDRLEMYVLIALIVFLSSALSAYVVSYFRKKGETAATRADFDAVLDQLRQSTSVSEGIRSEIQAALGERAALRQTIREKAEKVIEASFNLEHWLENCRSLALRGDTFDINGSPMNAISALQLLYFPDSNPHRVLLEKALNDQLRWMLELANLSSWPVTDAGKRSAHLEGFEALHGPLQSTLREFRQSIISNARSAGAL